jgi:hypothetical protein
MGYIPPNIVAEPAGDFQQLFPRRIVENFIEQFPVL